MLINVWMDLLLAVPVNVLMIGPGWSTNSFKRRSEFVAIAVAVEVMAIPCGD